MTYASPRGIRRHSAQAYSNVGLETQVFSASPERLITLLFDGALSAIAKARLHLQLGNIAERGMAISKAIDIVDSGLKASVDMDAGGELSKNLVATYEVVLHHLMNANLHADDAKLQLAESVLKEISSAWREACDAPKDPPPPAGSLMNTHRDILSHYQTIANLSGRMLTEAQASRWEAVFALGEEYRRAVDTLRDLQLSTLEQREARKQLLSQILDDDANIRRLAMPELDRLSGMLGNVKRQHRVLRTYSGTLA